MGCNCGNNNSKDNDTISNVKLDICKMCGHYSLVAIFGVNITVKCNIDNSNPRTIIITNQHCPINKF